MVLFGCGRVSRTGVAGRSGSQSEVSDILHSLVGFLELIEPSSVNVPTAKTEAVTTDSVASAIMLDVKSAIMYC